MLLVAVKAAVAFVLLAGVFAPALAWLERRQSAAMQGRIATSGATIGGIGAGGLFQPLADALKTISKQAASEDGSSSALYALAPAIAFVCAVAGWAVIPWGSTYSLDGGGATVSFVVADIDSGLLFVLAVGAVGGLVESLGGCASGRHAPLLAGLRAAAARIACQVPMGLSLVGVFLVFGTLRLTDMIVAQDTTVPLAGIVARFGWTAPGWASGFPFTVPAWGIVLQPVGFVLFLVCALASAGRPPFDVATGASELGGGLRSGRSGLQLGWFAFTDRIRVVVTAGLLTTVFLGGGAVPWLPGPTIVGAIAPLLGGGFATAVCMAVHVVVFASKLVVMIGLQELVRGTLPRPRTDQLMDLCWRVIAPLAIANALATALAMLLLEETA